jgi:hypothetical protein
MSEWLVGSSPCGCPCLRHPPLQHRANPLEPTSLQAEPRRRSGQVAGPLRELRSGLPKLRLGNRVASRSG